ncbi:MAG: lactate permease [Solirubrobacteraceae bacterium]|nr:lactate permease [Solirubrobacteraceae bacterium]
MYKQVFDPVGDSLLASALVAALPLITLFVLLGGLRVRAIIAAPAALLVAVLIAIIAYDEPVGQTVLSASEGAAFGFFPILWIVIAAIWVYNMTDATGHFAVLRRAFGRLSDDTRVQAVVVAFSFGALIEGLAGFGAPVAITSVVLVGLGFKPVKAATLALIGNTAPVAFGSIAVPIVTLGETTGISKDTLGGMVGNQTPILAIFVPFILLYVVDGRRGLREAWPAALVGGLTFGLMQSFSAHLLSVELTDILAALVSTAAMIALLRVWSPAGAQASGGGQRPAIAGAAAMDPAFEEAVRRRDRESDTPGQTFTALLPYLIIISVFILAQVGPIKDALAHGEKDFAWPGLHITDPTGETVSTVTYKFNWLPASGTLMFACGLLTMLALRIPPAVALRTMGATLKQLAPAILTVMTVLALAYVMNQSGQTSSLGHWLAGAGGVFAFLSSIVGWLGVAVTGSDTSSNALFGTLQVTAAKDAGINPTLLAAANSSGGVLGKMLSPQNLAIGAAAVGMAGKEGDLFRKVIGWSIVMVLGMAALVYLQSTDVLSWMVVD